MLTGHDRAIVKVMEENFTGPMEPGERMYRSFKPGPLTLEEMDGAPAKYLSREILIPEGWKEDK